MTPERWSRIDDLFDAALRLDPPSARPGSAGPAGATNRFGSRSLACWTTMKSAARDRFLTGPER